MLLLVCQSIELYPDPNCICCLQDYSPRYALELLALPLQDAQQRQRGFSLLRKLAFELPPKVSPVGQDRDGFLCKARTAMMPQELVRGRFSGFDVFQWQSMCLSISRRAPGCAVCMFARC
jgi:hypothetical protein